MRTLISLASVVVIAGCPADDTNGDTPADTGTTAAMTDEGDDGGTAPATSSGPAESGETAAATDDSGTTAALDGTDSTDDAQDSGSSTGPICEPGGEGCTCDGGMCDDDLQCINDVCVAPGSCAEHPEGEPNDTEMTAIDIGEVAGCVVGEIDGAVDADDSDWFSYHGTTDPKCNQDTAGIITADSDLEVCMFWACDQGNEQVVCFGMPEAVSPEGLPGCCGPANNVVFMQRECLGVGDQPDGTIVLEVRGPDAAMCVDYSLAYLF